ncbi:MFS transporter [Micromonospora sp. NPDC048063]|uniref:MFS transporter n=1 Tax=Micromonospora sp. NPDC048063 TaxID=3364256 RepID=UPI00371518AD
MDAKTFPKLHRSSCMQGEATPLNGGSRSGASAARSAALPMLIYVLALGTFLMGTTEFIVAGVLPEIAGDLQVSVAHAGLLITVFAIGMIIGAPLMAMLTLRLPQRVALILALAVFAIGHLVVALGDTFAVLLLARLITAFATGAFWALSAVVATRVAGPARGARAMGLVNAGGMLATALGVPLGAFAGQLIGWRGTFWALAVLALAATALISRHVPHEKGRAQSASVRSELSGLRSGRLWLALAGCAATTGGVLAAYSYIAPLLTDQAGVPARLVPLALVGFGVGALVGSLVAGRLGDAHPHVVTLVAPVVTAILLGMICLASGMPWLTAGVVVLLGFFGLGANPVLIALAVRFAGRAPTLASSLTVSAFNAGTAVGSWIAGLALASTLGATGPAAVGAAIVVLAVVPAVALALIARRRAASPPRSGDATTTSAAVETYAAV